MSTIKTMTMNEYIEGVLRTESAKAPLTQETVELGLSNRLFHSIMGISTEVAEMYDAVETSQQKGIALDIVNMLEEIGDAMYYTALGFDELGIDYVFHDVQNGNYEVTLSELRVKSANLLDTCKKTMFYGRKLDITNTANELTDIMDTLRKLVYTFEAEPNAVMTINLNKLKIRYSEKFNLSEAEVRNIKAERIVLERVK